MATNYNLIEHYGIIKFLCYSMRIMSKFEKFYSDELEPYEQDADNFNDFMESWVSFRDKEDKLRDAISLALSGQGGNTLADAIAQVMTCKHEYIEDLVMLTEVIFDDIERDEAVKIWMSIIDQTQKARLQLFQFIDYRATFEITPLSELEVSAIAYGAGRDRARADGLLDEEGETESPDQPYGHIEQIGIEQLHEILADDEIEWDNLSEVSEGDEYADWVLDEVQENLEAHIDKILEFIPNGLYEA